jgi:hypothetical protein
MYMILPMGTLTTALRLEPNFPICRVIGFALFAVRTSLSLK